VDNLLLSGDNQEEMLNTTISFINFLGSRGLPISKNKLQFAETEVKYLGHLISKGQ
jgi:vancomycin permeability regulator SanA